MKRPSPCAHPTYLRVRTAACCSLLLFLLLSRLQASAAQHVPCAPPAAISSGCRPAARAPTPLQRPAIWGPWSSWAQPEPQPQPGQEQEPGARSAAPPLPQPQPQPEPGQAGEEPRPGSQLLARQQGQAALPQPDRPPRPATQQQQQRPQPQPEAAPEDACAALERACPSPQASTALAQGCDTAQGW